jgi:hypothetical protein
VTLLWPAAGVSAEVVLTVGPDLPPKDGWPGDGCFVDVKLHTGCSDFSDWLYCWPTGRQAIKVIPVEEDMSTDKGRPLPWYYTVNDRPVKIVETPGGGMDVLALNMRTGEFERAMDYLSKCLGHVGDVDVLSEAEFERYVAAIRRRIAQDRDAVEKQHHPEPPHGSRS